MGYLIVIANDVIAIVGLAAIFFMAWRASESCDGKLAEAVRGECEVCVSRRRQISDHLISHVVLCGMSIAV